MVPAHRDGGGSLQPLAAWQERRDHPWVLVATAHPAKFNEMVEPIIGRPVAVPEARPAACACREHCVDLPPTLDGAGRSARMSDIPIDPQWIVIGAALLLLAAAVYIGYARLPAPFAAQALAGAPGAHRVCGPRTRYWCRTEWAGSSTSTTCC